MRLVVSTLCVVVLLAGNTRSGRAQNEELKREVGQMVQSAIDAGDLPGAIVGLWQDGQWVLRETYGHRTLEPQAEPMTFDTVFDMASITKPVATATSIMLLAQDGLLDLQAPVGDILKDFKGDRRDEVRVWHLLTHSAGLIPDNALADYQSGPEEAWRRLMKMEIRSTPGEKFAYSDVGFLLLGKIVETVSGQSLDSFTRQRIFEPLGMRDSGYLPSNAMKARIAPTEPRDGVMIRGQVHDPRAFLLGGVAGHAGLFSTLDDMALYAQMMLRNGNAADGTAFLKAETLWTMTRPFIIESRPDFGPVSRTRGWDHHSGYSYNGGRELSASAFGHGGFTGTVLWIDPDQNLFFVFLSNRLHPDGKGNVNQLAGKIATLAVSRIKQSRASSTADGPQQAASVSTGIDVLAVRGFRDLAGKRVGLVTNQTGIDQRGRTTLSLLAGAANVKLVALFSPEHGIEGKLDVNKISDSRDQQLDVPIYSLYGETRKPKAEQLAEIDILVYDIQDIGTRFYTYIATMKNCLEACAENGKQFMVLDRPNPIGDRISGPMRDPDRSTFVACHHLPVQHGMTVGELALLFAREGQLKISPIVVPVRNWKHSQRFDSSGQWWINPSPNMRTLEAALLYPGIGLLEMTNISVGRGTDRPFQWIGAPWMDGQALSKWLNQQQLPGVTTLPRKMTPDSSKHAGQECPGVQFIITDVDGMDAVRLGLAVARGLVELHKDTWHTDKLDVLVVNAPASQTIASGAGYEEVLKADASSLESFKQRRQQVLLYD